MANEGAVDREEAQRPDEDATDDALIVSRRPREPAVEPVEETPGGACHGVARPVAIHVLGLSSDAQSAGVSVNAISAEKAIDTASVTENWR